ncbi:MAG: amidohydrolase family protein [Steroidobacteraceae bacterium]
MSISKRDFLTGTAAAGLALYAGGETQVADAATQRGKYQRISCEECFSTPEIVEASSKIPVNPYSLKPIKRPYMTDLMDIGAGRIQGMDRDGVDIQLLSLSAPGVQQFDALTGVSLAKTVNDRMAAAIKAYPKRFAGLATVAPQDPQAAAKEIERAVSSLGLKGAIINSHTNGEYLSDKKYWAIFESLQALDVPLYIHPREPVPGMVAPLDLPGYRVGWAYAVETGTHALHLIASGVFDQFPKLRIVLGHMGENIPYLLSRIDNRYLFEVEISGVPKMKRLPSEYFLDHFVITTSGMNYDAPLRAALSAVGADRILFAADYPMEVQADAVQGLEGIKISAAEKQKIFETNPKRVFKL